MRLDDACDILGVVRVHDPHTRLPRIQGTRDEAQKLYRKLARSVLTRTSRSLRAVRMGYAYQPPACCTYRRRRAACPKAPRTAACQPRACRTYRVPRTVAPQVPVVLVGLLILGNSYAGESVGYPESYAPANRLTALQTINPLNFLDGIISGGEPLLLQPYC